MSASDVAVAAGEVVKLMEELLDSVDRDSREYHLTEGVKMLALAVRALATDTPIPGSREGAVLEPGAEYEFTLKVRATVVDRSDGCYSLSLEDRDYVPDAGVRSVTVDADEIVSAVRR